MHAWITNFSVWNLLKFAILCNVDHREKQANSITHVVSQFVIQSKRSRNSQKYFFSSSSWWNTDSAAALRGKLLERGDKKRFHYQTPSEWASMVCVVRLGTHQREFCNVIHELEFSAAWQHELSKWSVEFHAKTLINPSIRSSTIVLTHVLRNFSLEFDSL